MICLLFLMTQSLSQSLNKKCLCTINSKKRESGWILLPWGENTRRLMGTGDMPLLAPVTRSVSASISWRTSSKSVNFFPLQWRNSAHSDRRKQKRREPRLVMLTRRGEDFKKKQNDFNGRRASVYVWVWALSMVVCVGVKMCVNPPALELLSCRTRGLRVTMPDPRGRKSLQTDSPSKAIILDNSNVYEASIEGCRTQ